jgi:hypothetical protein
MYDVSILLTTSPVAMRHTCGQNLNFYTYCLSKMTYTSPSTPSSIHQYREHVVPVSDAPPLSPAPSIASESNFEPKTNETANELPSYLWDLLLSTLFAAITLTPFIALVITTPLALNDIRNLNLLDSQGQSPPARIKAEAARWLIILCWYLTGFFMTR